MTRAQETDEAGKTGEEVNVYKHLPSMWSHSNTSYKNLMWIYFQRTLLEMYFSWKFKSNKTQGSGARGTLAPSDIWLAPAVAQSCQ